MEQRFDVSQLIPDGYKAMYGVHTYVQGCGLDLGLLELVRLRISQINGCAFCVAMHIPLARKYGLSEHQINLTATWKESPVFSPRERAALAWSEAVTVIVAQEGKETQLVYANPVAHRVGAQVQVTYSWDQPDSEPLEALDERDDI